MLTCLLLDQCRTGVRSTPNAWRLVRTTPTTAAAAMNYVPRGWTNSYFSKRRERGSAAVFYYHLIVLLFPFLKRVNNMAWFAFTILHCAILYVYVVGTTTSMYVHVQIEFSIEAHLIQWHLLTLCRYIHRYRYIYEKTNSSFIGCFSLLNMKCS